MGHWSWAAASRRGTAHERCGTPRQDAFRIPDPGGARGLMAVVACDGAGSAARGGVGATIAAGAIRSSIETWLSGIDRMPGAEAGTCWLLEAREKVRAAACAHALDVREFATTAVVAVTDGETTLTAHVGDGAVVARERVGGAWVGLSWPEHGEFASTTRFLTEEDLSMRIDVHHLSIDRLAVMTDGLERLALDFGTGLPHAAFLEPMTFALAARGVTGRDREISRSLSTFLADERVNARTDDDKTLVLAVRS